MKLVHTLMAVALLSGAVALGQQERRHEGPHHKALKDLSVEQLATLKTKKMTLALDLTEKQQKQIMEFNMENVALRKGKLEAMQQQRESGERKQLSTEERYALENERLDHMIAQQETLRKILDNDQYALWKKMQLHKHEHHRGQKKMKRQSRRG